MVFKNMFNREKSGASSEDLESQTCAENEDYNKVWSWESWMPEALI